MRGFGESVVYVGPLILGIIIGAGAASGYFLSLPTSDHATSFIGAAVTVEVESAQAPQAKRSSRSVPASIAEETLAETSETGSPKDEESLNQIEQNQSVAESTAADPIQGRSENPPEAPREVRTTAVVSTVSSATQPQAQEIGEEETTSPSNSGGESYFPGLVLGGPPENPINSRPAQKPELVAPKPIEIAKVDPTQPVPTPVPATPPNAKPTDHSASAESKIADEPVEPDLNTVAAPIIKQADLVLPKRHPRLQRRR